MQPGWERHCRARNCILVQSDRRYIWLPIPFKQKTAAMKFWVTDDRNSNLWGMTYYILHLVTWHKSQSTVAYQYEAFQKHHFLVLASVISKTHTWDQGRSNSSSVLYFRNKWYSFSKKAVSWLYLWKHSWPNPKQALDVIGTLGQEGNSTWICGLGSEFFASWFINHTWNPATHWRFITGTFLKANLIWSSYLHESVLKCLCLAYGPITSLCKLRLLL